MIAPAKIYKIYGELTIFLRAYEKVAGKLRIFLSTKVVIYTELRHHFLVNFDVFRKW